MNNRMVMLFVINLAVSLGFSVSDAYFSLYAAGIGARGLMFAFAVGGYFAAKILFSPFTGILSDRLGTGCMLIAATAVYTFTSLSYVFFDDLLLIAALRILQGLGTAVFRPVILSAAGCMAPRLRRASFMGLFDISFYLAAAAGPVLGGFIRDYYGYRGLFILLFVLCAAAFLCAIAFSLSSGTSEAFKNKDMGFKNVLKNPVVSALIAFIIGRAFILSTICIFLPIYLEQKLSFSSMQIGALMSFSTVVMIMFLRPMGLLADHYPKNLMVISGGFYTGLLMLFLPSAGSFSELMLVCGGIGFAGAMSQPACSSLLIEEGEQLGLGKTAGVFNGALNIGFALAPFLGSFVVSAYGITAVFYLAGIFGLFSMLTCSYLMISLNIFQTD